jgi:hypothetical protein
MPIHNIEGMTTAQLLDEINKGARFRTYLFCVSVVIMSFKRSSDVYFVRSGQYELGPMLGYTFLSSIAGWWGIPWGPIYTLEAIITNISGGRDVTEKLLKGMGLEMHGK